MKKDINNHYDILNVSRDAKESEIEEAFRRAIEAYGSDSLALYSLYGRNEREMLLKGIKDAYETLKDPVRKSEYDMLLKQGAAEMRLGQLTEDSGIAEMMGLDPDAASFRSSDLKQKLVVLDHSHAASEQYRILYTKLSKLREKESIRTVAITSALKGEGKTITSLNLSCVIAQEFKKRCLLMECDLRNPEISSKYLERNGTGPGLADVLRGEADLFDAIVRVGSGENLFCLPVGQSVRNSSELISMPSMSASINSLRDEFEYIIIDCPPIIPLADMGIISRLVDGLLLVIRAGKTPKDIVLKAVNSIQDGRFLGTVLNGLEVPFKDYPY